LGFIDFLSKENNIILTEEDKELIYSYVGESQNFVRVINKLDVKGLKEVLEYMLKDETSKLRKLLIMVKNKKFEGIEYEKVINALKLFKDNYEINEYEIDEDTKEFLIKENILFLNPIEETLKPQSYLVWNAIKILLKD
jgi:hypothetical protein